jgi:hypothetical protein
MCQYARGNELVVERAHATLTSEPEKPTIMARRNPTFAQRTLISRGALLEWLGERLPMEKLAT